MSKQVLGLTLAALFILGAGLIGFLQWNKRVHLVLEGKIQKVRVQEIDPQRTIVITDFRITNPAEVLDRKSVV